jgi:mannose-6-phosphate isomerase-like protein (cupin superfamily)
MQDLDRRSALSFGITAASTLLLPHAAEAGMTGMSGSPAPSATAESKGVATGGKRGHVVAEGTDRVGNPIVFLNGRFDCKVSGQETDGRMCIFDTLRTRRGGPPLHSHRDQDEWFFVREGEFLFQVGEDTFRLTAGDSILGPRGIPHAFANVSETGRLVLVFQPAGSMEAFFRAGAVAGQRTQEEVARLHTLHGMEVVGPPLKID